MTPWAVVLAGGEGTRLRPLIRRVLGDERPKQYVPLLGPRSLLRQTLDRVALRMPISRTVVVTVRAHTGASAHAARTRMRASTASTRPGLPRSHQVTRARAETARRSG